MLFCITYLGFTPRVATERNNSAEVRLEKVVSLITESKFSIHDLSRLKASKRGQSFRLNMPFELGIDYGCRYFGGEGYGDKRLLVLSEQSFAYQAALSDIAGCDIQTHGASFERAMRKVRNWLVSEAGAENVGASKIVGAYATFQEWYYEKQLAAGFSDDDIKDYPTSELLKAMQEWMDAGQPDSYD